MINFGPCRGPYRIEVRWARHFECNAQIQAQQDYGKRPTMTGPDQRTALIVGGDGFLGTEIARVLSARNWRTTTTSRRDGASASCHLDLAALNLCARVLQAPYDWIIVVAALTSMQACDADPELAKQVNLEAPLALARHSASNGGKVLLFSTDMVVGQNSGNVPVDAPRHPVGVYGGHKAELEERFLKAAYPGAICRFAKVIGPGTPLIATWHRELSAGRQIQPFSDYHMSPISLDLACETVASLLEKDGSGLYQASSPSAISYAAFARAFAEGGGFREELVVPGSYLQRFGEAPLERDRFSLSADRLNAELGLAPAEAAQLAQTLGRLASAGAAGQAG